MKFIQLDFTEVTVEIREFYLSLYISVEMKNVETEHF